MSTFLCRALRNIRVYEDANSLSVSAKILPANILFYSRNVYTKNNLMLFEISAPMNKEDTDKIPVSYWAPQEYLDYTQIDDSTESDTKNDILLCNDTLLVNNNAITIYETMTSVNPVNTAIQKGDLIKVSNKYVFTNNEVEEVRYQIESIRRDGKVLQDLYEVGMWILGDYKVTVNDIPVNFHNSSVSKVSVRTLSATDVSSRAKTTDSSGSSGTEVDFSNNNDGTYQSDGTTEDTNRLNTNLSNLENVYDIYGFNYTGEDENLMSAPLGRLVFVHGMPFQFTYITDRRVGVTNPYGKDGPPNENTVLRKRNSGMDMYGRVFGKEIVSNMPIMTVVPGVPDFMTNIKTGGSSSSVIDAFTPLFSDLTDSEMDSAVSKVLESDDHTYQYYTIEIDTAGFYLYLNPICNTAAKLMGIGDFVYHGMKCGNFDWAKYNTSADQDYSVFEEVVGMDDGIAFAFDPLSSITDSLSNSTGQSEFAGMVNGLSSKARELEFLTGYGGVNLSMINSEDYEESVSSLSDSSGIFGSVSNLAARISDLISNTSHGMNIRFPDLWQDSSSSKSYSVEMHFITPYATSFCKWRYVIVPFFTCFCLAAPRSDRSITNYQRPFLIRAFSKGYFNVEMGIIENLTWKRYGDGDMISEDGIPTQIDVTMDFKDMYQQLAMSKTGETTGSIELISVFFNNTGLFELISAMSGVNVNKLTLSERISLYTSTTANAFAATGGNILKHANDRLRNLTERFLVGL